MGLTRLDRSQRFVSVPFRGPQACLGSVDCTGFFGWCTPALVRTVEGDGGQRVKPSIETCETLYLATSALPYMNMCVEISFFSSGKWREIWSKYEIVPRLCCWLVREDPEDST